MSELAAAKPYFKEDETYDKRVYENPWWNYFVIVFAIIMVYGIAAIVWWGFFSFGIYNARWMDNMNLIVFGLTIFWIIWLLVVGSQANKIKREHFFWQEQISLRKAKIAEEETRRQQEKEYEERLAKQNATNAFNSDARN